MERKEVNSGRNNMSYIIRKRAKATMAILLSLAIVFTYSVTIPFNYAYADGGTNAEVTNPTIVGTCTYPSQTNASKDIPIKYYYSDDYFKSSPSYSTKLATMSMNMAMAAFMRNAGGTTVNADVLNVQKVYSGKSASITQLLNDIGCSDVYVNDDFKIKPWFNKDTNQSSIGVAIAHKTITVNSGETYTLIPIAVRGAGYESEWASNVTLGASGEAKGFSDAADKVTSEVINYMKNHNISTDNVKFWITGYSRAGAVSNLTARRLIDNYGAEKTYAYCFEAPQGGSKALNSTKYNVISNMINPADLIPEVAPSQMGFVRYGVDYKFVSRVGTEAYTSKKTKMLDQLKLVNPEVDFQDYFCKATYNWIPPTDGTARRSDMSTEQEDFKESLMQDLYNYGLTRQFYTSSTLEGTSTLETSLQQIIGMYFSISEDEKTQLAANLPKIKDDLSFGDEWKLYQTIKYGINTTYNSETSWWYRQGNTHKELYDILWSYVKPKLEAGGMSSEDIEIINKNLPVIGYAGLQFLYKDYNDDSGTQDNLGSIIYNMTSIAEAHYPEINLAWLRANDSQYTNDTETPSAMYSGNAFTIDNYENTIIDVYDSSDNKVAEFKNGLPVMSSISSIQSKPWGDSERMISVPKSCYVKVTATSPVNYFTIGSRWTNLSARDTLYYDPSNGNLEKDLYVKTAAGPNGTVTMNGLNSIETRQGVGDYTTAEYEIAVGTKVKNDLYNKSGTPTFTAAANENYTFTGWTFPEKTGADTLQDNPFNLTCDLYTDDMTIQADFAQSSYNVKLASGSPGTITVGGQAAATAKPGDTVTATADITNIGTGNTFSGWTAPEGLTLTTPDSNAPNIVTFTMPSKDVTLSWYSKESTKYTVTVGGEGAWTEKHFADDNVSLTVTAPQYLAFDHWNVTGINADSITTTPTSTDSVTNDVLGVTAAFPMPNADVTVTPVYKNKSYKLDIVGGKAKVGSSTESSTSVILPWSSDNTETNTSRVTVTPNAPETGMKFSYWTAELTGSGVYVPLGDLAENATFTNAMPHYNITLTAHYEKLRTTLTINDNWGEGSSEMDWIAWGESTLIYAVDREGERFVNWTAVKTDTTETVDLGGNATAQEFNYMVPQYDVTFTPHYEPITHTASIKVGDENAKIKVNGSEVTTATIAEGDNVMLTAPTITGKKFVRWNISSIVQLTQGEDPQNVSFTMPGTDVTIEAIYEDIANTNAVTVNKGEVLNKDVSTETSKSAFAGKQTVAIKAADAPAGLEFAGWETSSNDVNLLNAKMPETKFEMPNHAVTLTATYTVKAASIIPAKTTVDIGGTAISATGSAPVYAVTGNDGMVTTDGATADNYNVKIEKTESGWVLTLKDAKIDAAAAAAMKFDTDDSPLKVVLVGDNTIKSTFSGIGNTYGIYSRSPIDFTGEGTLRAFAGKTTSGDSIGIYSGQTIYIESGMVSAFGYTSAFGSVPYILGSAKVAAGTAAAAVKSVTSPADNTYTGSRFVTVNAGVPVKGMTARRAGMNFKAASETTAVMTGTYRKTMNTITVPAAVVIGGKSLKVVTVNSKAFAGCKSAAKIIIGKNVKTIGSSAFSYDSKVKTVVFKGMVLQKISDGAFKTLGSGCRFWMPKSKYSTYVKLLQKSGVPAGSRFAKLN